MTDGGQTSELRREAPWVGAAAILFGVLFSYPIILHLTGTTVQDDWDFESELHWVAYYTVVHFHQFPLWDPYKCGGLGMLANPQSRFLTPFFLLHLVFGPSVGAHLEIPLHLAIAWAGGYTLARLLGIRPLGAAVAATVFPASSWFPLHLGEGHLVLLPFAYLPWFLVAMMRAVDTGRAPPIILAGFLCAITFGEGGVLIFLYGAPLIVVFTIWLALDRGTLRPITFLLLAVSFGGALAAVKLIPSYELVRAHPRVPWGVAQSRWGEIFRFLFYRDQARHATADRFFIEFGTYVSPFFAALAAAGLIFPRRRVIPWIIIAALLLVLVRGDDSAIRLWSHLKQLPGYSMMRLPSRFLVPLVMCIGLVAASGANELLRRFGTAGGVLVIAMLMAGITDSLLVGTPFLANAYGRTEPTVARSPNFRQFYDIIVFDQTVVARSNMGFVKCYDYTPWPTTVRAWNQPGYRGEQYLVGPGRVLLLAWTPNRIDYEVDAQAPAILVVNQNYDPPWHLATGQATVFSYRGLLAARVAKGRQHIALVYRGWDFDLGAAVSTVALLAAIVLLLWPKHRVPEHEQT